MTVFKCQICNHSQETVWRLGYNYIFNNQFGVYFSNSGPMHKDVSQWNEHDKRRALNSPSYPRNYYLQRQVKEYDLRKSLKK